MPKCSPRLHKSLCVVIVVVSLLAACEPTVAELVLDADGRFIDVHGGRGPARVMMVELAEPTPARVFFPEFDDDAAFPPKPLAVVFQGGLVEEERYDWLAIHLASKGHVAITPAHVMDLAFFQPLLWQRAVGAVKNLATNGGILDGKILDAPGIALGHSLGGVVAAKAFLTDETSFHTLVLLASEPDPADDATSRTDGRVLSLVGERDERILPGEVAVKAAVFASPVTVAVIEGMNHYQWTETPTESELATDGKSTVTDVTARTRALWMVDDALSEMNGVAPRVLDDDTAFPHGVRPPTVDERQGILADVE